LFEIFVLFFSVSFFPELALFVSSMHPSRGRLRTGVSEDRWMVDP
jgi:hypothetical protein